MLRGNIVTEDFEVGNWTARIVGDELADFLTYDCTLKYTDTKGNTHTAMWRIEGEGTKNPVLLISRILREGASRMTRMDTHQQDLEIIKEMEHA